MADTVTASNEHRLQLLLYLRDTFHFLRFHRAKALPLFFFFVRLEYSSCSVIFLFLFCCVLPAVALFIYFVNFLWSGRVLRLLGSGLGLGFGFWALGFGFYGNACHKIKGKKIWLEYEMRQ